MSHFVCLIMFSFRRFWCAIFFFFFFFNDTATTEIYTLSLHDALPIWSAAATRWSRRCLNCSLRPPCSRLDRKSTRLNSSHLGISYAVFCLKKKKNYETRSTRTCNSNTDQQPTNMIKSDYDDTHSNHLR